LGKGTIPRKSLDATRNKGGERSSVPRRKKKGDLHTYDEEVGEKKVPGPLGKGGGKTTSQRKSGKGEKMTATAAPREGSLKKGRKTISENLSRKRVGRKR